MPRIHDRIAAFVVALCLLISATANVHAASFEEALSGFTTDSYSDTDAAIAAVAASGDKMAARVIGALQEGRLVFDAQNRKVFIKETSAVVDAATGDVVTPASANLEPVRLNNRPRRSVEAALGGLTLLSPDPWKRLDAAQAVFRSRDAATLPALETAIDKEEDAGIKRALLTARAAVLLYRPEASESDKLDAIT